MTKKDYEMIAEEFNKWYKHYSSEGYYSEAQALRNISKVLAMRFEKDNSRFDNSRFIKACGVHPKD